MLYFCSCARQVYEFRSENELRQIELHPSGWFSYKAKSSNSKFRVNGDYFLKKDTLLLKFNPVADSNIFRLPYCNFKSNISCKPTASENNIFEIFLYDDTNKQGYIGAKLQIINAQKDTTLMMTDLDGLAVYWNEKPVQKITIYQDKIPIYNFNVYEKGLCRIEVSWKQLQNTLSHLNCFNYTNNNVESPMIYLKPIFKNGKIISLLQDDSFKADYRLKMR